MTAPLSEWDCFHCGRRCGGRLPTGYGSIIAPDGSFHAACHPDEPAEHPDCYRRVTVYQEPPGTGAESGARWPVPPWKFGLRQSDDRGCI